MKNAILNRRDRQEFEQVLALIKQGVRDEKIAPLLVMLLTDDEMQALGLRLQIIKMLLENKHTQREIQELLKTSVATVTRGSNMIKSTDPLMLNWVREQLNKPIIITIDGPSGAGKGTIAYKVAEHFGFALLDSGAVYRVLAFAAIKNNIDLEDEDALVELCGKIDVHFVPHNGEVQVMLNGENIGDHIRTAKAGLHASVVAKFPKVRTALLAMQRAFAKGKGLVADGRDMGTVVFKDADIKFFLEASSYSRAKRRVAQLQSKGFSADFASILHEIEQRDERDRNRSVAPLTAAADAFFIDSSNLSIEEVFSLVLTHINKKRRI